MKRIYFYLILLVIPAIIGIIYYDILNGKVKRTDFLYDSDGTVIASSPFPPSLQAIFGVDSSSNHMAYEVLSGYRITLALLIIIALLSLIIAIVIGTLLAFNKRSGIFFQAVVDPFFYIPQSILAYILLRPVLYEPIDGFENSSQFRVVYHIVILILLMIPTTIALVKESTEMIIEKEFIDSAYTLSPSKIHIYLKHIVPNMTLQYFITFLRILFQTLIVISHLAFFKIFFGGTDVCYGPACEIIEKPVLPELSSLMGYHFHDLSFAWWTFYAPLMAIIYMIVLVQMMVQRLENLNH
ncbi:ABC transporter permease subunit [Macrococcus brunensis]|uniref:ABC transporter permease subunit n=1 Tax=Macrococcus brunensis TaxID=198483 RepID=UPI001EF0B8DF|nr:ABC transporter permease subunit [Macrococcus brunensis]ULG73288.1 hypothetical protein MGG13_06070 [Macrococcus brunensis]